MVHVFDVARIGTRGKDEADIEPLRGCLLATGVEDRDIYGVSANVAIACYLTRDAA